MARIWCVQSSWRSVWHVMSWEVRKPELTFPFLVTMWGSFPVEFVLLHLNHRKLTIWEKTSIRSKHCFCGFQPLSSVCFGRDIVDSGIQCESFNVCTFASEARCCVGRWNNWENRHREQTQTDRPTLSRLKLTKQCSVLICATLCKVAQLCFSILSSKFMNEKRQEPFFPLVFLNFSQKLTDKLQYHAVTEAATVPPPKTVDTK